ncbi:hypothetical protein KIPB_008283, partial [Kipferlia bialata]|eukprot:g8283.t1
MRLRTKLMLSDKKYYVQIPMLVLLFGGYGVGFVFMTNWLVGTEDDSNPAIYLTSLAGVSGTIDLTPDEMTETEVGHLNSDGSSDGFMQHFEQTYDAATGLYSPVTEWYTDSESLVDSHTAVQDASYSNAGLEMHSVSASGIDTGLMYGGSGFLIPDTTIPVDGVTHDLGLAAPLPALVQEIANAYAKSQGRTSFKISSYFRDIPTTDDSESITGNVLVQALMMLTPLMVTLGLFTMSAVLVEAPVVMREKQQKDMLHLNGCTVRQFWAGQVLTDSVVYAGCLAVEYTAFYFVGDSSAQSPLIILCAILVSVIGLSASTNLMGYPFQ